MKRFKNLFSAYAIVGMLVLGMAASADAQRRNEREIRDLVRTLSTKIDDFQYNIDHQLRSGSASRQDVDDMNRSLTNLRSRIDNFENNVGRRRENRADIEEIVTAAKDVDAFLSQNPQNRRVQTDWEGVRDTIGRLAGQYGVVPDWGRRVSNYPDRSRQGGTDTYPRSQPRTDMSGGLSGTYRLDTARTENVSDVIANVNLNAANRQDLESKLSPPDQLAISVRGSEVTLASSNATPVTFVADGRDKTEQSNGQTLRLKATLKGDELTVASRGGDTDYTVIFLLQDDGRTLKVTRRVTTGYLSETVFVDSIYTKTDSIAGLGIDPGDQPADDGEYSSNDPTDVPGSTSGAGDRPAAVPGRTGEFVVPDGTIVTGLLENEINTKASQNNDRFRMTVQSPDEFRGAVIEGYISGVGRSGQVSGRSNVTFNFETITLRDGKTYDFAGFLSGIKDHNGKTVRIDTEGTAKGDSQTRETAKRGGIGAGLGAIIGAIAGGGKGAVLGAIIGGGAGAGSVIVQGRDDLQLMKGSTITVQASSPIRKEQPVRDN